MDVLYIVIPAYNESANIRKTVEEWYPVVEAHAANGQSRLVVINDGSRDDTYEKLQDLAESHPLMTALTKENEGHGPTLLYGYRYALEKHADYIFQTDSDGQTNPGEFEAFWEQREEYEAQFGNRTSRGDGSSRVFVERVLCLMLRLYYGVSIPDANAPFRLMREDYLKRSIALLPERYGLPNVMLTVFGRYYGRKIAFHPISFKPRTKGRNSINMKKIVGIGIQSLRDFWQIRQTMRQNSF